MLARSLFLACFAAGAALLMPGQAFAAGNGLLGVVDEAEEQVSKVLDQSKTTETQAEIQRNSSKNENEKSEKTDEIGEQQTDQKGDSSHTVDQTVKNLTHRVTDTTEQVGDVTEKVTDVTTDTVSETTEEVTDVTADTDEDPTDKLSQVVNDLNVRTNDKGKTVSVQLIDINDESSKEQDWEKGLMNRVSIKRLYQNQFPTGNGKTGIQKNKNTPKAKRDLVSKSGSSFFPFPFQQQKDSGRNRSGKTPIPMAIFSVPLQTTSVISPGGGGTGTGSFTPVFGVMTGNQRMSMGSEGLLISSFQGLRDQWEHAPPLPPPKQASSFSNGII